MFSYKLSVLTLLIVLFSLVTTIVIAEDQKVKESEFRVSGICDMCKSRIEKSLKIKEVKFARWNKNTKILKVAYLSEAVSADSLMKRVALAGHDNEKFTAPDEAYAKLHDCCLYRDGQKTH